MLTTITLRSIAGATALGSALAVSSLTGPGAEVAAPGIRNVACEYAPAGTSTTDLTLQRSLGRFGDANRATVVVAAGDTVPEGRVRLALDGTTRAVKPLNPTGTATFGLPGHLHADLTHTVTATFVPAEACAVDGSSDSAYYTVFKRGTKTGVAAPGGARGRATVRPRRSH